MTIEKISNRRANDILSSFKELEVYNSAISTLKSYPMYDQTEDTTQKELNEKYKQRLKELTARREELDEEFKQSVSKIQSKFTKSNCILKLQDHWYAILVVDELSNKCIMIVPVHNQSLACKKLEEYNPSTVGYMMKDEISVLLAKEEINIELINNYKSEVLTSAYSNLLKDILTDEGDDSDRPHTTSKHAIQRWRERKEGETRTTKDRLPDEKIIENILNSFSKSTKVWEEIEDTPNIFDDKYPGDLIKFYYNEDDNTMFVVSSTQRNIITLYEEDYGFCKEINVNTTKMQIKHIHTQYKLAKEREKELSYSYSTGNAELECLLREKNRIKARMDEINETIRLKKSTLSSIDAKRNEIQQGMRKEINLLFRKYK